MKTGNISLLIVLIILLTPLIYLAFIYSSLPQTVAVHFNLKNEADGYADKSRLFSLMAIPTVVALGIYFLVKNIHRIDPKKKAKYSGDSMNKIAFAIIILFAAINFMIVFSAGDNSILGSKSLLPLLGLFFTYLGNIMYTIKPNYFVGIRTPWALENEDNWRRTHQLAGKLWFAGGLVITIMSLLLAPGVANIIFVILVAVITVIPAGYSFWLFKKTTP